MGREALCSQRLPHTAPRDARAGMRGSHRRAPSPQRIAAFPGACLARRPLHPARSADAGAPAPRRHAMTTVLAAHLAFASAACEGPCPQYEYNPPPLPVDVTVLDATTGAVLCDALIALAAPCSCASVSPEFIRYPAANASCGYQVLLALSGPVTISVMSSGYAPKTVTVNVASPMCGPPAITTATVRLSRACETLTRRMTTAWARCGRTALRRAPTASPKRRPPAPRTVPLSRAPRP